MSKKLLNESTIRRFAGLAGISADVVSNFINEAYDDEKEMEEGVASEEETISEEEEAEEEAEEDMDDMMDMDADAEEGAEEEADMDMEMDMDADAEGGDDAEALVSDIVAKLQDLAKMAGVDIDVEMEDEDLDEMKYQRDEETMEEGEGEPTLEAMIADILAEEEEEEEADSASNEEEADSASKFGQFTDPTDTPAEAKVRAAAVKQGRDGDKAVAMFRQDQKDRENPNKGLRGSKRRSGYHKASSATRLEEEVVQEVLRRVRERLAKKTKQ